MTSQAMTEIRPASFSEKDDVISSASSFQNRPQLRSSAASSTALAHSAAPHRYFRSRRQRKEDIQRPWLDEKDSRRKWQWILPLVGFVAGCGLTVYLCVDGYMSVPKHSYCSVLDEDFSSGTLNTDIWTQEVQVGGFGYVFPPLPLLPIDHVC